MAAITERNGRYKVIYNYVDEVGTESRNGRRTRRFRKQNAGSWSLSTKRLRVKL